MAYKGDYNPREDITKLFEFPLVNASDKSDTDYYFHSEYEFAGQDAPDALTIEVSQRLVVNRNGATRDIDYLFYRSHPYNTASYSGGNVYSINKVRDYGVKNLWEGDFKLDLLTTDVYEKTHEWQVYTVLFYTNAIGDVGTTSSVPYDFRSVKLYDSGSATDNNAFHVLVPPKHNYEVYFDANGGEQAQCPEPLTKWHDEALAIPECVMSSSIGVFAGWSLSPGGEVAFPGGVIPTPVNEPLTLYAIWDSGHYAFSLDPCGGIGEGAESEREVGVTYLLEACPYTRPGYDFLGWSTVADGEPEYPDGGVFCVEAAAYRPSVTLYACWRREGPRITALACDRSGSGSATVAVGFSLYHAQDFDPEDAPTATVTVTASPKVAGSEGSDVVQVFAGISEPEALLEVEGLESGLAYDITVDVADGIDPSLTDTRYSIVGTGEYTMDLAPGGKGMGVFMKCPEGSDGHPKGLHVNAEDGFSVYGLEGYGDATLQALLDEVKRAAALEAHPVGSYYWSDDPRSPEELIGGEWEAITDAFIYAKGTETEAGKKAAGERGGEENHQLTVAEMAAHAHAMNHYHQVNSHRHASTDKLLSTTGTYYRTTIKQPSSGGTTSTHSFVYNDTDGSTGIKHTDYQSPYTGGSIEGSGTAKESTGSTGSNAAHNNMPPYIAAYCWRRVA